MKHHSTTATALTAAAQSMAPGKYMPLDDTGQPVISDDALALPLRPHIRFIELMALTGMKKSTLWAIQDPSASQYDPSFPSCYRLTSRTKIWKTVDVLAWIQSKQVSRAGAVCLVSAQGKECAK